MSLCRWALYGQMLGALMSKPMTAVELSDHLGIGLQGARQNLRRMNGLRLIHVGGWQPTGAAPVSVWHAGEGENASTPPAKATGIRSRHWSAVAKPLAPRAELIAFASIVRAMAEPITVGDLAEATGVGEGYLYRAMDTMRKARIAHIGDWQPRKGPGAPAAMWVFGRGPDVKRPAPLGERVVRARYLEARRLKSEAAAITRAITLTQAAA